MLISGKLFVWKEGAKYAPEEAGVYVLYNKEKSVIYVGGSSNIRETFTNYLETNFSDDPRKRETRYYKRKSTQKWKKQVNELLDTYRQTYGELPRLNTVSEKREQRVAPELGFYFYKNIGESLSDAAFSLEDFHEKVKAVPIYSLEFHQKRGDFTRWIRDVLKKPTIADKVEKINNTGESLREALLNVLSLETKQSSEYSV